MKKLYVGNLSFNTTEETLNAAFAAHGTVLSAVIVQDRETGRPRGLGFVEMENGADEAMSQMNGRELDGRALTVNEARPRREHSGGGGGRRSQRW